MPSRALITNYKQDLERFPDRWHKIGLVVAILLAAIFLFTASTYWTTVANLTLVAIVGASGLMILTGFTGQISLGHAAFMAIGAYTSAILATRYQLPFFITMPLSGLLAAAVGLAVGPFALRLRGLYLAIVTLGLSFLVNHVLLSFPSLTHGVSGMTAPIYGWFSGPPISEQLPPFTETQMIGNFALTFERRLFLTYLVISLLTILGLSNLRRSDLGRAMMAVRDHDLAAAVLGINPTRVKLVAFGVSSFIAGIAGAMFAFQQQFISIDPPFNLIMSVQYIAMIVLGGIGTVFGAVAGPIVFTVLHPVSEALGESLPFLDQLSSAQQSTLLFSVLVMGFLLFEPLGVYGLWLRIKRYFLTWPFSY